MKQIRLELRVKNNVLWRKIYDSHPTLAVFCKLNFLPYSDVCALINFKMSPRLVRGGYKDVAKKLAFVLDTPEEELFPLEAYKRLEGQHLKTIEIESLDALPYAEKMQLEYEGPSPEDALMDDDRRALIAGELKRLSRRERIVIAMTYGFDGESCMTLDEIGARFQVTRERIRQIRTKAIRKLFRYLKTKIHTVWNEPERIDYVPEAQRKITQGMAERMAYYESGKPLGEPWGKPWGNEVVYDEDTDGIECFDTWNNGRPAHGKD